MRAPPCQRPRQLAMQRYWRYPPPLYRAVLAVDGRPCDRRRSCVLAASVPGLGSFNVASAAEELQTRLRAWDEIRLLLDAGELDAAAVNALREDGIRVFYG